MGPRWHVIIGSINEFVYCGWYYLHVPRSHRLNEEGVLTTIACVSGIKERPEQIQVLMLFR